MAFVDTEQYTAGEVQQKVGRLKLSEALRIGARLRPQGFGAPIRRRDDGTSCAMQAIAEGMTGILTRTTHEAMELSGVSGLLCERIWMQNDGYRLSRESIADWLQSQG